MSEIIQLKLVSGEEIIARRHPLNSHMYNDVMVIERQVFTNSDEYTGEITGTSIFYMMKSWFLHQFDKRDDDVVPFVEINPTTICGAFVPHKNTVDQYLSSVEQLKKNGEFGDDADENEIDSDWEPDSDDDTIDLKLLEKLKSTSRLN
jgi:hypothetical protein